MLLVSDSYAQSTEFVEPRADFLISLFGGQGVMPQRKIFSIKNASLVLNIAPTLCALLTLSRTMTIGVFLAFLYSSTVILFNSLLFMGNQVFGQLYLFLLLTLIFSLAVWYQMINSHLEYLETGVTGYFMGFPTASAWQMYGIWLSSVPLIFLYSIGFRRYVFSDSDEKEFDTLLEKNHSNDE